MMNKRIELKSTLAHSKMVNYEEKSQKKKKIQ